jgi:hypothetical protein
MASLMQRFILDRNGMFICFVVTLTFCRKDFVMNCDLWHKVYPMTKDWKTFVHQRSYARGPYKYPFLMKLWSESKIPAHVFKRWWVNCSEV